jgi:hypothetical protein
MWVADDFRVLPRSPTASVVRLCGPNTSSYIPTYDHLMCPENQRQRGQGALVGMIDPAKRVNTDRSDDNPGREVHLWGETH